MVKKKAGKKKTKQAAGRRTAKAKTRKKARKKTSRVATKGNKKSAKKVAGRRASARKKPPRRKAKARRKSATTKRKRHSAKTLEREARRLDNTPIKTVRIPAHHKAEKKIRLLAREVVELARREIDPFVDVPSRTLSNVTYSNKTKIIEMGKATQRRSFFNLGQARKFMQTIVVANGCTQLLREDKTTSIRDLYYMTKHTLGNSEENTFDEQDESDPVIEDLEVTLGSLREELHLFASKRGSVVGPITIVDAGDTINLARMGSGGWSVPGIVEPEVVQFKKHSAKFILLLEKEAVWARLNEDKFWQKHKCILVTGQGQPPRGVRRLLYRMVSELKLPVYVFVDNDPWGYYIHSVVKQGSINLAFESSRMAVPSARFLGLSSFDPERFKISEGVSIRLNDQDRSRAKEILAYPWFHHRAWQKEIKHMVSQGVKWEQEALSNKGLSFVTNEYLPKKIRDRSWI